MEKINTPLGELIQSERDMLRMANSAIDLSSDEEEKEFFRSEKIKHLYAISMLKQALPKECEVIKDFYNKGRYDRYHEDFDNQFNQTFKTESYE